MTVTDLTVRALEERRISILGLGEVRNAWHAAWSTFGRRRGVLSVSAVFDRTAGFEKCS
jgi:hypothetical protein